MANTEPRDYREELHLLLALRRSKDNDDGPRMCFREIIRNEPVDLERLKVRLRTEPGTWRIHRTINARSVSKAARVLQHKLIDDPLQAGALETIWKTCLLQMESRVGRNVLLDIDDPSQYQAVERIVAMHMLSRVKTPSGGYHIVCTPFDTRLVRDIPDVTIQRDGYVFLEQVVVPE